MQTTTRTAASQTARIAMVTPSQVCQELAFDEQQLLAMVNDGSLPAYDLGGQIRFKAADVASLIGLLAMAG